MKFPPLNPSTTTSSSLQVMAYLFRIFFNPLHTYLFFFFYPKRVSIVDSLFRFFFLFRFIQYQHGILHTRTKKIKGEKLKRYCLIFSFVFCLLFLFLGPGGIDQLTSQRVASGRQHQGCIRIYSIPRCYKGGIDPF